VAFCIISCVKLWVTKSLRKSTRLHKIAQETTKNYNEFLVFFAGIGIFFLVAFLYLYSVARGMYVRI